MRSLIRAAVVVLSAVTVALGVAPAARAADFSIYLQDTWWQGGGASVCPAGAAFESGQTVLVQVLEGGSWVAKRTYGAPAGGGCVSFDPRALVPGPGTYSFQALSRVPSTDQVATAPATTFTLSKDDGWFRWLGGQDGLETTKDFMGFGVRLSTRNLGTALRVGSAHGQFIDLQRKAGSKWVNVSRAQAPATGNDVIVRMAFPKRPGWATHRFVSRATAWSPQVVTASFNAYQSAVVNRSSYKAEARTYMAKYCPKTPISLDTPGVSTGAVMGRASVSWSSSGGTRVLRTQIELRSGMAPDMLRFVALHECGHIIQYRSIVPGRYTEVNRQANKLWPGLGLEGQADCMAFQVTRDPNWFGYVDGCSKAQLVNAATMWQTYGSKYQAATYRW